MVRVGGHNRGTAGPRQRVEVAATGGVDLARSKVGPVDAGETPGLGSVLHIPAFRKLWLGLGLSSLGDWLGLLALTAMANQLADGYAAKNFAIAGVLFLRVLPAIVVGPLAGYVADRLDRRVTLVWGDYLRGLLFLTIPLVGTLWWVFVVTVLVEIVTLVWSPAKDATLPNLVPTDRLEAANQLSLATTYGSAVPAAAFFSALTFVDREAPGLMGTFERGSIDAALYINGASFIVSGLVIARLRAIPSGPAETHSKGLVRVVWEGWSYVGRTPLVRGLVLGMVGAFAAGGVVVGLSRTHVADLGGGDSGYGFLFGAVFVGMALGLWRGPGALRRLGRRRGFGLALIGAGLTLVPVALLPRLELVAPLAVLLGFQAGVAWVTGMTLLGLEVPDAIRGRTFAFVGSLARLALALVLAVGPLLAGTIGEVVVSEDPTIRYGGAAVTILAAAVLMTAVGVLSYRLMLHHEGGSVPTQPTSRRPDQPAGDADRTPADRTPAGCFLALEGGEGAGKSTQAARLHEWLSAEGFAVVLTHEPGDTAVGRQVRRIVLDPSTGSLADRTEALLYAADKAEHVARVIAPALAEGAVVVTDRYVDSTLAYQGAGRDLADSEVEHIARWATGDLRPDLTVLLDVDPGTGLTRFETRDRIEGESVDFHHRVRDHFLRLAARDPERYLVLDARLSADEIEARIRRKVASLLDGVGHVAPAPEAGRVSR